MVRYGFSGASVHLVGVFVFEMFKQKVLPEEVGHTFITTPDGGSLGS